MSSKTRALASAIPVVLMLMFSVCAAEHWDSGTTAAATRSNSNSNRNEAESKFRSVHERVSPAVVRVRAHRPDGKGGGGQTGVIVSTEGLVVSGPLPTPSTLTFQLSDGRQSSGKEVARSREWGITLTKIDDAGPWPHVSLSDIAIENAGSPVVTLGYAVSESSAVVPKPILRQEFIYRLSPGHWFLTPSSRVSNWRDDGVAFDVDGRLLGIGSANWPRHGAVYTSAITVRSLFDGLASGMNTDQLRLAMKDGAKSAIDDASKQQEIPEAVRKAAIAASVRIRVPSGENRVSGTIVNAVGLVVTCAHHFFEPGTNVIVDLTDGREATGRVVGWSLPCDIGLVQITDPAGPFPHVEMGTSAALKNGDRCFIIGYGPVPSDRHWPEVRDSSVVSSPDSQFTCELNTDPHAKLVGGDSGGGVFDAAARLIAVHHHGGRVDQRLSDLNEHGRIELVDRHRAELNGTFEAANISLLDATFHELQKSAESVGHAVVEILDGDKVVALGTIVGADGRVLTKASVLPQHPFCRLSDDRLLEATVVKTNRRNDTAELKVAATGLPMIQWSDQVDPPVGTLTLPAKGRKSFTTGLISHPAVSFPAECGSFRANLEESPHGLTVTKIFNMPASREFLSYGPQLLEERDVLLSVNGHPTPDRNALKAIAANIEKDPIAVAGDLATLVVLRNGKRLTLQQVLGPPSWPRLAGQSARSTGFSRAYSVMVNEDDQLCGGPILDTQNRALGIVIAQRNAGWLLILPAAEARSAATK